MNVSHEIGARAVPLARRSPAFARASLPRSMLMAAPAILTTQAYREVFENLVHATVLLHRGNVGGREIA